MVTVYLLIGLPGSWKTTFASTLGAEVISIDSVRQGLAHENKIAKSFSSADNDFVYSVFHEKIKDAVSEKHDVVVDSPNATLKERNAIYDLLSDFKPKFVAVVFEENANTSIKRIEKMQSASNDVHYFENPSDALKNYSDRLSANPISFDEPVAEIMYVKNGKITETQQKVLIASTNLGKIDIYADICKKNNIPYTSLAEIKVEDKIEETGSTERENAIIKATSYHKITSLPVIANDSGLVIDKFSPEDQPGVFVRRYRGKELSDVDLLNVYIEKLKEIGGESEGHYNVALALITSKGELTVKEFKPKRYFISTPSKVINKGVPLSSLAYDFETKRYLSEMTPAEKNEYEKEEMSRQRDLIVSVFTNQENRTKR